MPTRMGASAIDQPAAAYGDRAMTDTAPSALPSPPPAARLDLVEDLFGHAVADPYRWLEDPTTEQSKAWAAGQDALYEANRATWPGQDRLRGRLTELLGAGLVTPPI